MAPTPIAVMLMKRVTKGELGSSAQPLLHYWIYINLIGSTILLPLVVLTFLISKNVRRHPTLINLCITWVFSGIISLLLFYTKKYVGQDPSESSVCIAQASLIFGIPPMWAVATLAMVYYMVQTLRGWRERIPMALLLSAPYIAECAFSLAALTLAIKQPKGVTRHSRYFFCSFASAHLYIAMSTFNLLMATAIVVLEVILAFTIYRNWLGMREIGLRSGVVLPLVIRVLLFGLFVILGIVVDVISLVRESLIVDIYMATAGTVVFLIFGTQLDVLRTWCFCWGKRFRTPEPVTYVAPPNDICQQPDYQCQDISEPTKLNIQFPQPNSPALLPTSSQIFILLEYAEPSGERDSTVEFTKSRAESPVDAHTHKAPVRDLEEIGPGDQNGEGQRSDQDGRSRSFLGRLSFSSRSSTQRGVESSDIRSMKDRSLRWRSSSETRIRPMGPRLPSWRTKFYTANAKRAELECIESDVKGFR